MWRLRGTQGFLVIEVLIAGLIITSSIAATMYLFNLGYRHLERAGASDAVSSKLPQAVNLLKTTALENKSGKELLGDGVELSWEAGLIAQTRPLIEMPEGPLKTNQEIFLYKVNFQLKYRDVKRAYEITVFRHKNYAADDIF